MEFINERFVRSFLSKTLSNISVTSTKSTRKKMSESMSDEKHVMVSSVSHNSMVVDILHTDVSPMDWMVLCMHHYLLSVDYLFLEEKKTQCNVELRSDNDDQ